MKPKSKPPDPDPNAFPRQIEDQNRWVWDLYVEYDVLIEKALVPLREYIKCFDKYKEILEMDPEKECREINGIEPELPIGDITKMIDAVEV